jgi:cell division protein FtsW
MIGVSKIDYIIYIKGIGKKYKFNLLFLAYTVCIFLQFFVLFWGVENKGAKRWIKIPMFGTFQPSELTKICIILLVACIVSSKPKCLDNPLGFVWVLLYVMPLLALVLVENLSTAIIIAAITFIVCFVVARKKWYFWVFGAAGVAIVAIIISLGEGFRGERIQAWQHVETHDLGYQILQGLYAIASGGLWGKGLGQSMQKLGFIPESHNDMIFSVICEELGIVGALAIILLYVLLLWRLFVVAVNARELFGSLICVGIMVHIAMQVIINIAVVTNTIPSTGIPLPFISYGGTSLLVLMAEMGIALSVSNRIEYER